MSALTCALTTPERLVYEGEADSVVVPAEEGELGILTGHAALVGTLGVGELRIKAAGGEPAETFFVSGGFVQVVGNRVTVLASDAQPLSELSTEAENAALEELRGSTPPPRDGVEAREAHDEKIRIAKIRLRMAHKASA